MLNKTVYGVVQKSKASTQFLLLFLKHLNQIW